MKKVILVVLSCLLLGGCSKVSKHEYASIVCTYDNTMIVELKNGGLMEYTFYNMSDLEKHAQLVEITSYGIKVIK